MSFFKGVGRSFQISVAMKEINCLPTLVLTFVFDKTIIPLSLVGYEITVESVYNGHPRDNEPSPKLESVSIIKVVRCIFSSSLNYASIHTQ